MRPLPWFAHDRDDLSGQCVPAKHVGLELLLERLGRKVFDGSGLAVGAVVKQRVEAGRPIPA